MARESHRVEEREKDRRHNEHHHDKDHRPADRDRTVTERLKAKSTQSGQDAMNAAPSQHPPDPANADAVYTTGPGEAVEYNYQRLGTYSEDYAQQQAKAGPGQIVTAGAANNPT